MKKTFPIILTKIFFFSDKILYHKKVFVSISLILHLCFLMLMLKQDKTLFIYVCLSYKKF